MSILDSSSLPARLEHESAVEELLSRPSQALIDDLARLKGDIMVLGVGGKIGPTLARLAKRAAPARRIVGVARFSDAEVRQRLIDWNIETIACDLLDRDAVAELPDVPNVIYMAGRKFGTSGDEPFTWAMNVDAPAITAERFRDARIVAFSTLCVYPFTPVSEGGATEATIPGPPGEYANSCLGRERMFEYFSAAHGTPGRLIRLGYAIDMRYGVLHELATKVRDGTPINLTTGHTSMIWQGDASAQILRCLLQCTSPTTPLNITAPNIEPIRSLAEALGDRLGKRPQFEGEEADRAWLMNGDEAKRLFGPPLVETDTMLDWIADWVARDGASYGKPTHYDSRDGRF